VTRHVGVWLVPPPHGLAPQRSLLGATGDKPTVNTFQGDELERDCDEQRLAIIGDALDLVRASHHVAEGPVAHADCSAMARASATSLRRSSGMRFRSHHPWTVV